MKPIVLFSVIVLVLLVGCIGESTPPLVQPSPTPGVVTDSDGTSDIPVLVIPSHVISCSETSMVMEVMHTGQGTDNATDPQGIFVNDEGTLVEVKRPVDLSTLTITNYETGEVIHSATTGTLEAYHNREITFNGAFTYENSYELGGENVIPMETGCPTYNL